MKTVVVIPALNEEQRISMLLREVLRYAEQVVVVDDGSSDHTYDVAQRAGQGVIALRHRLNLGKGSALKTGCEAALRLHADRVVLMDSDGQHKASDIPRLLKKMETQNVDIVFGSRKIGRAMPLVMMIGNAFLSRLTSVLFGIRISDTQSGFRSFRADVYSKIKWDSRRYSVETEMIVNAGKHKLKFAEVEIETIYHDNYKGTTFIDGIRIFLNILMWRII
ncbi:MAG: glycosyltransferase family 2 protein [Patescibacteria group bacterium]|jgi:glycosyltransferase involved in cell wall biosynthesis